MAAAPVAGRGSLPLGWARPTTQKAADSGFCFSFWDFCFVLFSFPLWYSFLLLQQLALSLHQKEQFSAFFWRKNVEKGILFGEIG